MQMLDIIETSIDHPLNLQIENSPTTQLRILRQQLRDDLEWYRERATHDPNEKLLQQLVKKEFDLINQLNELQMQFLRNC